MNSDPIAAASALLFHHWQARTRLAELPVPLRPTTRQQGYAIQARLEATSSKPLFGWKIAATSIAGQKHIHVDGPLAGRILAERALPSGSVISLGNNLMRVAEIEFAFRMARDLPPHAEPYSLDAVMAAVATLHPSIEIPDSRFEDFCAVGAAQLIADNACAHLLVTGEAFPDRWRNMDLAGFEPVGHRLGPRPGSWTGKGANVLGDPRLALVWLVNELSSLGVTLKAGQTVTTGTCLTPIPIEPGDRIVGIYGDLGEIDVKIA